MPARYNVAMSNNADPIRHVAPEELEFQFIRSSGPGGQNVNKVATAVQLRFDAAHSPAVSAPVFARLREVAGRRMTAEGVVVITAQNQRTQGRNREEAVARLGELLRRASIVPKQRRKTKPSRAARQHRLDSKRAQADKKRARRAPGKHSLD